MGTQVRLTRSGGLAGLSLVASVDLDELPEPTANEVRAALDQVDFGRPVAGRRRRGGPPPGAADTYQYDLVVDDGERTLTAHEPLMDPGLQALSQVLLPMARPE